MSNRCCFSRWLAVLGIVLVVGSAMGQVAAPPTPTEYDVQLRYRIRAPRNERVRQYLEMTRDLGAAGLVIAPSESDDALDANAERLHGHMPSSALSKVLAEAHVRTLLLIPRGAKVPDGAVPINIELVGGLTLDRQQLLHSQTLTRLALLGFVEKVGYDHRGFTRIYGTFPADALTLLLADLRTQPSGWLMPDTTTDLLPEPIKSISPLRIIYVEPLPEGASLVTDAVAPTIDAAQTKLSPDLSAVLKSENGPATKTRLDVILYDAPSDADPAWRNRLAARAELQFEGVAGQIVTVNTTAGAAIELAKLPQVAAVRLPVRASASVPLGGPVRPGDVMTTTNLAQLHGLGGQGKGVKIAIVDSDFSGLRRYLGKTLPPKTSLLDLTAERNPSLEPDALPNDRPGRGTLAALAAGRAAPLAELILVRVDEAAPHQVLTVARALSGEAFRTEAMHARHAELLLDNNVLRHEREQLLKQRIELADNFDAGEETQKRRTELQAKLTDLDRKEKEYAQRLARFTDLESALLGLRQAALVANNLNWLDGLPADGFGALATFLDGPARLHDRRKQSPVAWLQSAGDVNGQVWAGPVSDFDRNGILEFAPQQMPIPVGRWTRELNFLSWEPHDAAPTSQLPAGAHLKLTLQWTEAQDTSAAIDHYRWQTPLNKLHPVLLRQADASGKKLASDDLAVVARAATLPQLIARGSGWSTYEHVIEFTVDAAGSYAVRLEGQAASSTTPPETPTIPAAIKRGEVYPRLTVSLTDTPSRDAGRPVFGDYRGNLGGSGSPADAHVAIVVGAANAAGRPQQYSPAGPAAALALNARPTILVADEFDFGNLTARGTAQANGFAAGTLAAMISAGGPASTDLKWLRIAPGGRLAVPQTWLEQLAQRGSAWSGSVAAPAAGCVTGAGPMSP